MNDPRLLEGTLIRVNYSDEETGYVVARLEIAGHREPVTVVGNLWGATLGETIRLRGEWVRHSRYGEQFRVEAYESILPTAVAAIERYLASGLIKGIGPAYARRLVSPRVAPQRFPTTVTGSGRPGSSGLASCPRRPGRRGDERPPASRGDSHPGELL